MSLRLPTPFFKEMEGFSFECNDELLTITLPEWLVPIRRYCQVTVSRHPQSKSFIINIEHEEPFNNPAPGRNAWQTALHNSLLGQQGVFVTHTDTKSRRLDRKWNMVRGLSEDIRALRAGMMRGNWPGTRKARTLVKATPTGFRIVMYEARHMESSRMRGLGCRVTHLGAVALKQVLDAAPNHGSTNPCAEQPMTTGFMRSAVDRVLAQRHEADVFNYHNCRCVIQPTTSGIEPTFSGVKNMRKIDTTSNVEVPFDTSGTKIVKAVFDNGAGQKDYAYYADESLKGLAVGDYAVVISPYGSIYDAESQGFVNIVQITSLEEDLEGVTKAAKWLVQKVDLSDYRDRLAKALRIRTLDARIETAKKEAMKRVELQRLMEASPELADLIKERLSLSVAADVAETKEDAVVPSKA